jgi:hypothetical protein
MHPRLNLRTSSIAIVTILALLMVPACGSLCAAMNHCSSASSSTESDACHHANMSPQSDSEALSSAASCSQPSPLLAILVASDSSVQLESAYAANGSFSIDNADHAYTLANQFRELSSLRESPQQSTPLENLSVLRI